MANELAVTFSLSLSKANLQHAIDKATTRSDVAGSKVQSSIESVGTGAHELLDKGDIGTVGYVYLKNLDATNFVTVGIDDGGAFKVLVKIMPGKWAFFQASTSSVYAKADTGACELLYLMIEA